MAHAGAGLGRWRDRTVFWVCVALAWVALCAELIREVPQPKSWHVYPFLTLMVMGLVPLWRLNLVTTVRANAEYLLVRNRFRTWHVEWRDIEDVLCEWGEGPWLRLRDGRGVRLDAYLSWPAGDRRRRLGETMETWRRQGAASESDGMASTSSKLTWGIAEGILVFAYVANAAILLSWPDS